MLLGDTDNVGMLVTWKLVKQMHMLLFIVPGVGVQCGLVGLLVTWVCVMQSGVLVSWEFAMQLAGRSCCLGGYAVRLTGHTCRLSRPSM